MKMIVNGCVVSICGPVKVQGTVHGALTLQVTLTL